MHVKNIRFEDDQASRIGMEKALRRSLLIDHKLYLALQIEFKKLIIT